MSQTRHAKAGSLGHFINVLGCHEIDPDTCIVWPRSPNSDGYGTARVRPYLSAHRAAYQLFGDDLTDDLTVDHLCRNRGCVNPFHLEAVPPTVNVLRGDGPTAQNARKTHCPKGHELTPANTIVSKRKIGNPFRQCRRCHNDLVRERERRKRIELRAQGLNARGKPYTHRGYAL